MLYTAHIVMQVVFTEEPQTDFPVWENIVLVQADTPEAAEQAARQIGLADEGNSDGTLTWNGKKARWAFAGIRRLVSCMDIIHHAPLDGPEIQTVGHGTEVTYLQFTLKSHEDLQAFLKGSEVELRVDE